MSEQQEHPEGTVAAQEPNQQPTGEPEAPIAPPADTAPAQTPIDDAPADATPSEASPTEAPVIDASPEAAEATPVAEASAPADANGTPSEAPDEAGPAEHRRQRPVGPKIVGQARERSLPVVKKRLQEKPKREPLPWPELRAAVAATRDQLDVAELKELFRQFPEKLRDEVTQNVRGFQKGARRPVSQHAAKQLARASHTARRMKKNAQPSGEVAEALGQAMAAELIASLEPEKAAQVILPKRDLLEREARQAQRRARDEEDRRRDEQRRRRREDARSSRQQTSFGEFSGAKIKGLDEIAAIFGTNEPEPEPPQAEPEPPAPAAAAEPEAPTAPAEPEAPAAPAEPEAPAAPPAQANEEAAEQRAVSESPAVPEAPAAPPADAAAEDAPGAPAGESPS